MKFYGGESSMQLPDGKSCGDCRFLHYCTRLFGAKKTNTTCDYSPSRFVDDKELRAQKESAVA